MTLKNREMTPRNDLRVGKRVPDVERFCQYRTGIGDGFSPGFGVCTYDVQVSTTRRLVPHIEELEEATVPRSTTDSTEQWVCFFIHMRFMLHVFSVICLF